MIKRIMTIATFVLSLYNVVLAEDKLTINDFIISAGETKDVSISLANDWGYVAFQFDLYLPDGFTVESYSVNRERIPESTTLSMKQQEDGAYRFISAAMEGESLVGYNGTIVTLKVKASESLLHGSLAGYFRKVKLSKADATGPVYNEMFFPITVIEPSVVIATNVSRLYGEVNPLFEYTVTGGALIGEPEITCCANETASAGDYDIIVTKGTISNYSVTYVNGTLTVTKAPLTIKAKSYTITQGDALPSFEAEYCGFKNNETADILTKEPVIETLTASTSEPGTFEIIISGAEAQNYDISYIKGTLTINPRVYKLIYMVDDEVYKNYDIEYGTAITPQTEPTKEGYTFSGWSEIPESMPAHDVTITGSFTINKYKLTYMVDGEVYKDYEFEYETSINPEATPTKEGYTFSGWSAIPETMPAHDVIITGSFSKGQYKLTYIVDGQTYKTINYDYGGVINSEPAPVKEGYTFSGWSEIPETMPAQDVIITGTFTINKYIITYRVDGEVYKTFDVEYGVTITPIEEPTKEGYTFSGWSKIPETMPAQDVTINGTFTIKKYKLTYEVDGEIYMTYNVEYGAAITPEDTPTKEGYTFSGWSAIPETMPAHDVIITGSFSKGQYKLTYIVDGQTYKIINYDYGDTITPEPVPVKEGYTFSGWSKIPETMPAQDVTVTGSFTVNKYKLIYMVDGEVYRNCVFKYGEVVIPEAEPTKEGYTFSGWSEIPPTMPAQDVTVTGTFTINKYELNYEVDGEIYKTYNVEYGANITPEATPTKEGYTFSGWSAIPETMPAHDVTVTGSFTVNKYKLIYMVDGEVYRNCVFMYGEVVIPEAEPTKEGYTFSGWSEIPAIMPAHDVTVTGTFIPETDIKLIMSTENSNVMIFTLDGKRVNNLKKGMNVIRMKNGNMRKVVVK